MTSQRASKLKIGDRVRERYGRHGTIEDETTNYVGVLWDRGYRVDNLARSSPLWANIEIVLED